MRWVVCMVAIGGCAATTTGPATPAGAGELRLTWRGRDPGIQAKVERTEELRVDGEVPTSITLKEERMSEVLEVDGEVTLRERVRTCLHRKIVQAGDERKVFRLPLQGKTFEVWSEDGAFHARRDDGTPVTTPELEALEDRYSDLGSIPDLERLLTSRPWTIGEAYALDADELALLGAADDGSALTRGTLTLVEVVRDIATFNLATTVRVEREHEQLDVERETTLRIDIEGVWLLGASFTGQFRGLRAGEPTSGTIRGETRFRYYRGPVRTVSTLKCRSVERTAGLSSTRRRRAAAAPRSAG